MCTVRAPAKCAAPPPAAGHTPSGPRGHGVRVGVPPGVGASRACWSFLRACLFPGPPLLSPMSGTVTLQGWRRPKTRTAMPRPPNHKANGGGATSNGSTPSTPIGQGQQVSSNQAPSPPPDMAASNKNKNKKVKGGCLLSAPSKSCLPARG